MAQDHPFQSKPKSIQLKLIMPEISRERLEEEEEEKKEISRHVGNSHGKSSKICDKKDFHTPNRKSDILSGSNKKTPLL